MNKDNIPVLIKEVKEICQDERYEKLSSLWKRVNKGELVKKIPVRVSMDPVWWAKTLEYNLKDLVFDVKPEVAIEFQLKQKIFYYQNVPDDTIITPDVNTAPTWTPTITPFGAKYSFDFKNDSWQLPPLIKAKKDLDKLPLLNFNKEKYEEDKEKTLKEFNEIVEGEIPVRYTIPEEQSLWGPFACACNVYGYSNILMALAEDKLFIHRLMEFVTESRLKYEKEKSEAIGISTKETSTQFSEDEVDCNVFSPKIYQELIFPYESKIAKIFKGILFHSCGNLTSILDIILKLPNLRILHISPWTNLEVAVKRVPAGVIFEKRTLSTKDIFQANPGDMEAQIKEIFSLTKDRLIYIVIDGIMKGKLNKPLKWLEIARQCMRRE